MIRIVIVSPMHAGNVGSIARVCGNFNIEDICVVSPRCDIRSDEAKTFATYHAQDRLLSFKECATLADALKGAQCVVGLSRRIGDLRRPDITWSDLPDVVQQPGLTCLVFGSEDTGLSQADLTLCTHICALPTHTSVPSMNLSQAVTAVLAGSVWQTPEIKGHKPTVTTRFESEHPVSADGMHSLVEHWRQVMVAVGLTRDGNPDRLLHYYHRVLNRSGLTEREANMLHGFLSQIEKRIEAGELNSGGSHES
ncbi:MAG: hypothetical protein RJB13_358 [Pseudomonadota bacterium]